MLHGEHSPCCQQGHFSYHRSHRLLDCLCVPWSSALSSAGRHWITNLLLFAQGVFCFDLSLPQWAFCSLRGECIFAPVNSALGSAFVPTGTCLKRHTPVSSQYHVPPDNFAAVRTTAYKTAYRHAIPVFLLRQPLGLLDTHPFALRKRLHVFICVSSLRPFLPRLQRSSSFFFFLPNPQRHLARYGRPPPSGAGGQSLSLVLQTYDLTNDPHNTSTSLYKLRVGCHRLLRIACHRGLPIEQHQQSTNTPLSYAESMFFAKPTIVQ